MPQLATKRRPPPFFTLPPELRNKIYILVLSGPRTTLLLPVARPSLLKINRQITAEASPIFTRQHDFYASLTTAKTKTLVQYLRALGPEGAKAIASLTISLDVDGEVAVQREKRSGAGGVMNYLRWFWVDVPGLILGAGVRAESVTIAMPRATVWTGDVVGYARRWVEDKGEGLPGYVREA